MYRTAPLVDASLRQVLPSGWICQCWSRSNAVRLIKRSLTVWQLWSSPTIAIRISRQHYPHCRYYQECDVLLIAGVGRLGNFDVFLNLVIGLEVGQLLFKCFVHYVKLRQVQGIVLDVKKFDQIESVHSFNDIRDLAGLQLLGYAQKPIGVVGIFRDKAHVATRSLSQGVVGCSLDLLSKILTRSNIVQRRGDPLTTNYVHAGYHLFAQQLIFYRALILV